MPGVKPGGYLTYITCSVYAQENEGAVSHILSNGKFRLLKKSLIRGYDDRADTLFAALFISAV
jgi:16S rRNA (cytosine967-C5)-methyltransferase